MNMNIKFYVIETEEVEVLFRVPDHARHRRGVGDTPLSVHVDIRTNGGTVPLRLRRIRRHIPDPKLFSSSKNGLVQESLSTSNVSIICSIPSYHLLFYNTDN